MCMKLATKIEEALKGISSEEQEIATITDTIKNEYGYSPEDDLPEDVCNTIWDWLCTLEEGEASFEEIQKLSEDVSECLIDEEHDVPVRSFANG